jgi:hypothetical protein
MNKTKKILSAALAVSLALALGVPACADEGTTTSKSNDISVTVPGTTTLIFNPYGLKVSTDSGNSTDQIIHEVQSIVNTGDVDYTVTVSARATLGNSKMTLVNETPDKSGTDKELLVYMEVSSTATGWATKYTGAANQLLMQSTTSTSIEAGTLASGTSMYFHFSGAMTTGSEELWASTDSFTADVIFSFTPVTSGSDQNSGAEAASLASLDDDEDDESGLMAADLDDDDLDDDLSAAPAETVTDENSAETAETTESDDSAQTEETIQAEEPTQSSDETDESVQPDEGQPDSSEESTDQQ